MVLRDNIKYFPGKNTRSHLSPGAGFALTGERRFVRIIFLDEDEKNERQEERFTR
jgi:hypothetical protein